MESAPPPEQQAVLEEMLAERTGPFWGGLWLATNETPEIEHNLLAEMWMEGIPDAERPAVIRINERHRSLSAWLYPPSAPPWQIAPMHAGGGPPIVSFYAFKDGTGRSTALASSAAQRAHAGERVVIVDLDLTAPDMSMLLGVAEKTQAGIVDYCLEQPLLRDALELHDYYIRINQPEIVGRGEICVFPAGAVDALYLPKLARLDFTPPSEGKHPL